MILRNPEVSRVYVGSFWDQPLRNAANRELFEAEQQDLFNDLQVFFMLYFLVIFSHKYFVNIRDFQDSRLSGV